MRLIKRSIRNAVVEEIPALKAIIFSGAAAGLEAKFRTSHSERSKKLSLLSAEQLPPFLPFFNHFSFQV